jgi:hypothetical protein
MLTQTPEQRAYIYIRRIRSERKRTYAAYYLNWCRHGKRSSEPERGELSAMAAQAVRLEIDRILRGV